MLALRRDATEVNHEDFNEGCHTSPGKEEASLNIMPKPAAIPTLPISSSSLFTMNSGRRTSEVNCVHCSICLDAVADDGNRSWAKLQCGHKFHLDCIGSAFNAKGAMQCPNCRKIEKGQWLFPNGGRSFPDYSMEDWTHD
ncbi:hypothetical protein MLD38_040559 [Melastoma candidum]|nr:hypothetical protein MLD38_040559 [Melastoma candidum]